jgi:hypothetical protein
VTVVLDDQILSCIPERLAEWRVDEDGRVVAERPKPSTTGLRGVFDRLHWLMSHPRIRLDEIGSFVWQHLDRGETLGEIAGAAAEAFPGRAEGMNERLALFAAALHHQGLIELRIPDA